MITITPTSSVGRATAETRGDDILLSGTSEPPGSMNTISLEEADALLAKELSQMSVKDRNNTNDEIHGVADPVWDESPDIISQSLFHLNIEIEKLRLVYGGGSSSSSSAYQQAVAQDPTYANNDDFRLMFLRAEGFDQPARAAERIMKFFEIKRTIFGVDKLTKEITLDDLGDDAESVLKMGYMTLLPARDRSGRCILFIMPNLLGNLTEKVSAARAFFYVLMTALKDVENQRKGLVFVGYNLGGPNNSQATFQQRVWYNAQVFLGVPSRLVSFHTCYDNPLFRPTIGLVMMLIGQKGRMRFRAHYGTHVECQYVLMTFGIPVQVSPVSKGGDLMLEHHLEWLSCRRKLETRARHSSTPESVSSIEEPSSVYGDLAVLTKKLSVSAPGGKQSEKPSTAKSIPESVNASAENPTSLALEPNDVVVGRGSNKLRHPGNARYHKLVEEFSGKYDRATQFDKRVISEMVVHRVRAYGGRFLKKDGKGGFAEIANEEARSKVSHAFRNRRLLVPGNSKPPKTTTHSPLPSSYPKSNREEMEPIAIGQASVLSVMAGWHNAPSEVLSHDSENSVRHQPGTRNDGCFNIACFGVQF